MMYEFRPMTAADLPMVKHWLGMPHVMHWWGKPDEQFALVRDDLEEPAMDQFVVMAADRPFAYLQSYRLADWNFNFGMQPIGTRGIDQFIGEPDMVSRGHGSAFIRSFIDRVLAEGAPRVITDPDPRNLRAVRAYEKAGFRKEGTYDTAEGPALLMVRDT
jgi:aminoglycoside 6'-N-acetyltransferase